MFGIKVARFILRPVCGDVWSSKEVYQGGRKYDITDSITATFILAVRSAANSVTRSFEHTSAHDAGKIESLTTPFLEPDRVFATLKQKRAGLLPGFFTSTIKSI